ncbi:hypothetical protein [Marinoscillum pacificum]|uniref:hypothetical protein n=1 Tax=Marinoscillum pacificum TaxID=392723 RepID=UPI00215795CC|nr:hypothetical protein [Marinoscillum pacificum]
MKLIARIILILSVSYLSALYLPWWSLIVVAFLVGFGIPGNGINQFIAGFLGGGLLWMTYAWLIDVQTESILSEKIVKLFPLDDPIFLLVLTGLLGAIAGALGALSGNSFRQLFMKKKQKSFYS